MKSNFSPIVTIPSKITFREPQRQHPKNIDNPKTVSEVAKKLEKDYEPLHIFYRKYKDKIKSVIIEEVKRAWNAGRDQEIVNNIIAERIKALWRQFILRDETGVKTRAAQKAGRQSFLDTGTYYKSMKVQVK